MEAGNTWSIKTKRLLRLCDDRVSGSSWGTENPARWRLKVLPRGMTRTVLGTRARAILTLRVVDSAYLNPTYDTHPSGMSN